MKSAVKGRIAVIGGGLGGLAAACTLAARGYKVTLFEKSAWLGGKAAVLQQEGFRFDMGPTILTIPEVLKRIFQEAGVSLDSELDLVRLDPQWRCFFTDGNQLDLVADTEQMANRLDSFAPNRGAGAGYRSFMNLSQRLHVISDRYFFWKPIGNLRDMFSWWNLLNPTTWGDVFSMRPGTTVGATVRKYVPDDRAAQMIDHYTQYVGSSPFGSPAVLCGIAHMQSRDGVWYPMGGTRAVPEALIRLGTKLGVEFRANTGIRSILTDERRGCVRGVVTETDDEFLCEAVVSNADAVRTHRELLGTANAKAVARFENRREYEPACSGVVLYLGLKQRYEQLLHHNFVFSADPEAEFRDIYERGEPAADPTCYVCAPAITEPGVAPPGGEALYVLVHTPYLRDHHDWKAMLPAYRSVILNKLKTTAGLTDIEERIVFEAHLTPQDIHDRYRVLNGAIYGIASHGRWMGAFKPSNRSPDLRGLYLAGGAAHPGPGMPMVLMSGWIAADTLDRDGVVAKIVPADTLAKSSTISPPTIPEAVG